MVIKYIDKLCKKCGNKIPVKRARDRNKEFCDRNCVSKFLFKKSRHKCLICSNLVKNCKNKFCSRKCSHIGKCKNHIKLCEYCNKEFVLKNIAEERRGKGKYCSIICSSKSKKIYSCNEFFFSNIDDQKKSYWLGFLMADGYNSLYETVINLKTSDSSHLDKFIQDIDSNHKVKFKKNKYTGVASLRISSKQICSDLTSLGCVKAKSLIIDFPKCNKIPDNLMNHFIRGYFDGDGCISVSKKGHKRVTFYSGSINFIDSLEKYLLKCKIPGFKRYKNRRFLVCSNTEGVKAIYNFLYNNSSVHLDRKKHKFDFF